jgi:atypical dual specificity phosphatase
LGIIARLLFYPTLLWNLLLNRFRSERRWWDWIDDDVLLGALPFRGDVKKLRELGVSAVVNTCIEYAGPANEYARAGIEQMHIPTVDFTPPSYEDIVQSVEFIKRQTAAGKKVYIHCKAGRGRSATIAVCYLISKGFSPEEAQRILLEKRPHVMPEVYKREVVQRFAREMARIKK